MNTYPFKPAALGRASLIAALGALALTACDADLAVLDPDAAFSQALSPAQRTFFGAAVEVGDGIGRTYYTTQGGALLEVGVALSEAALRGLPEARAHGEDEHRHDEEYVLQMHPRNPTLFQHVGLNWVPNGHKPKGIYDLPHFDVHFYMISEAERNAIGPSDPQWEQKANNLPAAEFIPENYVSTNVFAGVAPLEETYSRMGLHWIDVNSPELNGSPFTATFIYGSYDGRMIFAEPMITKAFLETQPNVTIPVPVAGRHAVAGNHPGAYRVYWHEARREYRIALSGFAWRQ